MLRIVSLVILLSAMCALTIQIFGFAPYLDALDPFFPLWEALFGLYFLACLVLLLTKPTRGRWRWVEMGLIMGGALLLRALLVPLPPHPGLSRDSWRYLWDARITLLGYSPYVSPPNSPQFAGLHDFLFENSRFRNVPTIYPPAAQAVYLLSYLLSPSNIYFLKGIFVGCDLLSCGLIVVFLKRRGLDPARVLLYAWCPLPIVEFAFQGHLDALPVLFSLLTALSALGASTRRERRAWAGFWLAVTTLAKLYPLVYIAAVWHRRDRVLPLICALVIVLSYVPYVILGRGQIFGFFSTYIGEASSNPGPLHLELAWLGEQFHLSGPAWSLVQTLMLGCVLMGTALGVWLLRQKERISVEAALLLLTGMIFLVSPHVFPWYTAALLPWVAILVRPLWSRSGGLNVAGLIVAAAWYLACLSIMGYPAGATREWGLYYWLVYGPLWLALWLAVGHTHMHSKTLLSERALRALLNASKYQILVARGWLRLRLPTWSAVRSTHVLTKDVLDEKSTEAERIVRKEVNRV